MELMDCFKNVKFERKEAFFVAGIEGDIHYNSEAAPCPIAGMWTMWHAENLMARIPYKVGPNIYGITHSETADSIAKYTVCAEVSSQYRENYATFNQFPAIEVYDERHECVFAMQSIGIGPLMHYYMHIITPGGPYATISLDQRRYQPDSYPGYRHPDYYHIYYQNFSLYLDKAQQKYHPSKIYRQYP
ncbi:MAG: hypothetical protein FWC73_08620 [Defluviitaleaceae bacterium]|nr:hypothetical protein [Defluviitaleaceae bacterium]